MIEDCLHRPHLLPQRRPDLAELERRHRGRDLGVELLRDLLELVLAEPIEHPLRVRDRGAVLGSFDRLRTGPFDRLRAGLRDAPGESQQGDDAQGHGQVTAAMHW